MPEIQKPDETQKKAIQIIRLLRITISNIQLYSPENQLVKDSIKTIGSNLNDYLSSAKTLTISESEQNLLLEGKALKGVDKGAEAFIENLLHNNLKSLTFKYGVTPEEVNTLLAAMGIKRKGHKPDIAGALKTGMVRNIEANEKVFVVQGDGDGNAPQSDAQPESSGGNEGSAGIEGNAGTQAASNAGAGPAGGQMRQGPAGQPVTRKFSAAEKAREAIGGSRKDLIVEGRRSEVQGMLKELDSINRLDLAGEVVDRLAENLDDTEAGVRLDSVRTFKQLNNTINSLSDRAIINRVEEKFIATEDKESSDAVYVELADVLEEAANRSLNEGEYEKPKQIVKMFRSHRFAKDEGFEKRWQHADTILKRLAESGLINILIQDLRSGDTGKKQDAYAVLLSLEEFGVYALLNVIKNVEDIHLRRIIAFIVKNIGAEAVKVMVSSISADMPVEEARRIIEVLDGVEYYDIVVAELKGAMNHYSPTIRKEILATLSRIPCAATNELVLSALNDYDSGVKKEAIKSAGRCTLVDSVPSLISYIVPESIFSKEGFEASVQEAACGALGVMKEISAIPVLAAVAGSSGGVLKLQKAKSVSVRAAALFALANFKPVETKNILEKFAKDSNSAIAKAARDALRKQSSATVKKAEDLARKML